MKRENKFLIITSIATMAALNLVPLMASGDAAGAPPPPNTTPTATSTPSPTASVDPLAAPGVSSTSLNSVVSEAEVPKLFLADGGGLVWNAQSRSLSLSGQIPYACYANAAAVQIVSESDPHSKQISVSVNDPNGDLRNCINRYKAAHDNCSEAQYKCVDIQDLQNNQANSGDLGDHDASVIYLNDKENPLGSIVSSATTKAEAKKKLVKDQQALEAQLDKEVTACLKAPDPVMAQQAFDDLNSLKSKLGEDQEDQTKFDSKLEASQWAALYLRAQKGDSDDLDSVLSDLQDWADSHPSQANQVASARIDVAKRYLNPTDGSVDKDAIDSARDAINYDKDDLKHLSATMQDNLNFEYRDTEIAEDALTCHSASDYQSCSTAVQNRYQKWVKELYATKDQANATNLKNDISTLQKILTEKYQGVMQAQQSAQQSQAGISPLMPTGAQQQSSGMTMPNGTPYAANTAANPLAAQRPATATPGFTSLPGIAQPNSFAGPQLFNGATY